MVSGRRTRSKHSKTFIPPRSPSECELWGDIPGLFLGYSWAQRVQEMARNVLEEGFELVIRWIQSYGWVCVGVSLALYFSWPQIQAYRKAWSLASANAPERRKVLDAERLAIRLKQQKALDHVE